MRTECSDGNDEQTARQSEALTQSLANRGVVSGARGQRAPVCLARATATSMEREKPNRRDDSTFFFEDRINECIHTSGESVDHRKV